MADARIPVVVFTRPPALSAVHATTTTVDSASTI
jgi:hypothetical protein